MKVKEAIVAFSQSDKIKSGIIWTTQSLELLAQIPERNRKGAEKLARIYLGSILRDVHVSARVTGDPAWRDAEKHIDMALVMLDSGVAHECSYHLTRALSRVTDIGRRSMAILQDRGLL